MESKLIYSSEFFAGQVDGSARSAAVVVPLVLSLLTVRSVGVDGDYVDRSQLRIPDDRFLVHDLTKSLVLDRTFDLAVCLEVAEHLPVSRADSFVADLTRASSCVLFSAAIPGPTGTGHIHPQYMPYWVDLVQAHGYEAIDPIRPQIWGDNSVEWFYQQDTVIFVARKHPLLSKGYPKPQTMVHPHLYKEVLHMKPSLRTVVTGLPGAVLRSIRYHLDYR
jgi:hypothetical protein